MMHISIPPELGIPTPADMPIVELIRALYTKGHTLHNRNGKLMAVPIKSIKLTEV